MNESTITLSVGSPPMPKLIFPKKATLAVAPFCERWIIFSPSSGGGGAGSSKMEAGKARFSDTMRLRVSTCRYSAVVRCHAGKSLRSIALRQAL
jgi:hypothetical protein